LCKSTQLLRVRSINLSKPVMANSNIHRVTLNANTAASGAKDSEV
jgi:hypothetical protein